MESTGNSLSLIKTSIKSHGLQKQLAIELGMSESNLTKFLDGQLPTLVRLLAILHLEVVEKGEVDDLKRVLKRCL